ncbi:MAG: hypothetical protein IT320_06130 [Anaerolineae bacterium]|nr:hypothetical protein [Anaerolineae bacterium]
MKALRRFLILYGLVALLAVATLALPVAAQDGAGTGGTISFTGTVSQASGTLIVVNGLTVSLEAVQPAPVVLVGMQVTVQGVLTSDGRILAQIIIIIAPPDATPVPTATATPTLEPTPGPTPTATPVNSGSVVVVIEGPVEAININVITIYNINIVVNADDPVLTVIQIGDIVRVEGEFVGEDDDLTQWVRLDSDTQINITIIAITIVVVDIDVNVGDDGVVWRDPGNCGNPPPPWAPAHGWRRRCEGGDRDRDDDDDD